MFDCNRHLVSFHDDKVTLTEEMKRGMRQRRNANQDRLARGLKKFDKPKPIHHVQQGSYAMHTMVQSEYDSSDIDDGVIFKKDDLVGLGGGKMTPLRAKNMVRDALDDGSFNQKPEVHTNCVRIFYNDGFTIDIPVYRECESNKEIYYELASTEWKRSDPEGVTTWFNRQVIDKSPDTTNGRQMRRIVRLLKAWSKSRKSWNMPSGFILSILTDEVYYKDTTLVDRDDRALIQVMESIYFRINSSLVVHHPVMFGETVTKSDKDANMLELKNRLSDTTETLSILRKSDCTELDALKALRDVFSTDYFDDAIEKIEKSESACKSNKFLGASSLTVLGGEPYPLSV